jgi:demethylmenaquinone methyltransferase/2-methoxy-6-polyprenyl-1,4-benzoquinol methylase
MTVVPYKHKSDPKKKQVEAMFNNIAPKYDFLNSILSAGIDKNWRKKALTTLKGSSIDKLLDVATGTGAFAIEAARLLPVKQIIGIDISEGMLEIGKQRINKLNLSNTIQLLKADSENLPFNNNTFNAVTVAFGVRNFENLEKGLSEMHRVLTPGGKVVILEFSKPERFPIKQLYFFYFKNILPSIGKIVSKDDSAYHYLPQSVNNFPYGNNFKLIMQNCGYKNIEIIPLTFGIASIYIGTK